MCCSTSCTLRKVQLQGLRWESNSRPRESSATLCQLSHEGRCRERIIIIPVHMSSAGRDTLRSEYLCVIIILYMKNHFEFTWEIGIPVRWDPTLSSVKWDMDNIIMNPYHYECLTGTNVLHVWHGVLIRWNALAPVLRWISSHMKPVHPGYLDWPDSYINKALIIILQCLCSPWCSIK